MSAPGRSAPRSTRPRRIRRLIRERTLAERYLEDLELHEPEHDEDIRELISRGLDLLRSPDRRLLALIYVEGLSYQEVADRLERPIGSIGPLRGRALKRLARASPSLSRSPQESSERLASVDPLP
jgi:RNA polymerase sigma factor (sigma-70 family)